MIPKIVTISPDDGLAKRRQLRRYVLDPSIALALVSLAVSVALLSYGNIFDPFELAGRAFLVGAVTGGLAAFAFGRNRLDWIPGLTRPAQRLLGFCLGISLSFGLFAMASALAIDRFVLPGDLQVWEMRVSETGRTKGGAWVVDFTSETGRTYRQEYRGFCPPPEGFVYRFYVRTGILGYPFFVDFGDVCLTKPTCRRRDTRNRG